MKNDAMFRASIQNELWLHSGAYCLDEMLHTSFTNGHEKWKHQLKKFIVKVQPRRAKRKYTTNYCDRANAIKSYAMGKNNSIKWDLTKVAIL